MKILIELLTLTLFRGHKVIIFNMSYKQVSNPYTINPIQKKKYGLRSDTNPLSTNPSSGSINVICTPSNMGLNWISGYSEEIYLSSIKINPYITKNITFYQHVYGGNYSNTININLDSIRNNLIQVDGNIDIKCLYTAKGAPATGPTPEIVYVYIYTSGSKIAEFATGAQNTDTNHSTGREIEVTISWS